MKCPKCATDIPFKKVLLFIKQTDCINCNSKIKNKRTSNYMIFFSVLISLTYFPAAACFPNTPDENIFLIMLYRLILQMLIGLFVFFTFWKLDISEVLEAAD